jgi:hypothetical protein
VIFAKSSYLQVADHRHCVDDGLLGRKNYLFAGSDSGGERAATVYSLLGIAKLIGLDPFLSAQDATGELHLERIGTDTSYPGGWSRVNLVSMVPWMLTIR